MTEEQCLALMQKHHIYPDNGNARQHLIAMIKEAFYIGYNQDIMKVFFRKAQNG